MTKENTTSKTETANNKAPSKGKAGSQKLLKTLGIVAAVILVLGGLSILGYTYKHLFIVGRVNNKLITRVELNKLLINAYGPSAVEELVNKKLIKQELKKQGIEVTAEQLQAKKDEISQQIQEQQGTTLEDYLDRQGVSMKEFEENIETQLAIEQLLAEKVEVTEEEVDDFLETYGDQLEGETEEDKRAQAVDILVDQQIGSLFQQWIQEVRSEAKIDTFLK
ncbi:hypothetical protein GF360_01850 [candidate division WWE3 bacterium]|nr:hypothetical protein [candidate division WWE3 bacterium]